jgi:RNA polymerase sigma-70 factor (ECF subfamily)
VSGPIKGAGVTFHAAPRLPGGTAHVSRPRDEPFDEILSGARARADWAWARIYEELAPKLIGYLRAHGAEDPEDLAGEVFLQMVRGMPGFSGDWADFRAWTFTIAHRRLIDDRRRRTRRPVSAAPEDVMRRGRADARGDVCEDAEARMADASVRAAIDQLPPDQKAVVLLRIIGDLTVEQVAVAVGKRPGAVKALQRRGLHRLEQAYPFEPLQRLR